jgi:sulfate/thiosulfate-binding protein
MSVFRLRRSRAAVVLALASASAVGLSACGSSSSGSASGGGSTSSTLNVVGFSVIKQAYTDLGTGFAATSAGKGVTLSGSYGASGAQARAVVAGQKADVVALSLEPDMATVQAAGKVAAGWDSGATKGIASDSVVVISFRKGNPLHITGWNDIIKPGVKIVTADPATSGSAKWNLLGAYVSAAGKDPNSAAGKTFLKSFIKNVVSWNDSGRDATNAFSKGTGDVLISYENEAIAARAAGIPLDYLVPSQTILIQNPIAATTTAPAAAKSFVSYVESAPGQQILAKDGFRPTISGVTSTSTPGANDPSNPFPAVANLITIDDLGGWTAVNKEFFDKSTGIVTLDRK